MSPYKDKQKAREYWREKKRQQRLSNPARVLSNPNSKMSNPVEKMSNPAEVGQSRELDFSIPLNSSFFIGKPLDKIYRIVGLESWKALMEKEAHETCQRLGVNYDDYYPAG
jgi:hypothetical protein